MKLREIIFDSEIPYSTLSPETEVTGIALRAPDVAMGNLYIVTNPDKADFHLLRARPSAIICDERTAVPDELKEITERCDLPRRLAARAYARFCRIDFSAVKFIGITGTNGKTTTSVMLKKILCDAGYKIGYIGTGKIEICGKTVSGDYYSMTTPEPPVLYPAIKEMIDAGCEVIVMEVSSHALALDRVEPIPFEYGIFTNLSPEHTDFHPDMEDYFLAKSRLMSSSVVGVFNVDDTYSRRAARAFNGRRITVGVLWKGEIYAKDIELCGLGGTKYIYRARGFSFMIKLGIPGIFNVYNSMLALAVAIDMGVRPCKAKESLASFVGVPGRYEIIKGDVTVIIDYAHTAVAFENMLKSLNTVKIPKQKLTIVFGCGGERDRRKRPAMGAVAAKYADLSYLTSDNPRGEDPLKIIEEIIAGFDSQSYVIEPSRESAIRKAILSSPDGGIVAVIGKGAEKYTLDADGYHSFDERKIIEAALAERESQK